MYQSFLAGSHSGGWAGFGAGCAAAHVVAHVCPSSTSVPRAASSAASSCSCKQRCVASPVGPWAGGARAGLTGSSGLGCGARYRRRAAPPPRAAARGTASALRPSPAVAARRAPGGEAGAHARAGLAEQYGVGPRTTDTCSASSASSHETMLMPVRRACTLAARDLLRQTDAPSAKGGSLIFARGRSSGKTGRTRASVPTVASGCGYYVLSSVERAEESRPEMRKTMQRRSHSTQTNI